MLLDLDDGILDMKVNNKFITLSASEKEWPLSIGNISSVSSRDFRVDWDGYLRANNATISGTIYADSGTLGNLDVTGTLDCSEGTILGATIMGGTISGAKIYFGDGEFYIYEGTSSTGKVHVLKLKERKILVRHFTKEKISDFVRISIGTEEEIKTLVEKTKEILSKRGLV